MQRFHPKLVYARAFPQSQIDASRLLLARPLPRAEFRRLLAT